MNTYIPLLVSLSLVAVAGCGRDDLFEVDCPEGTVLRSGRCRAPTGTDGGVNMPSRPDVGFGAGIATLETEVVDFGSHALGTETIRLIRFSNQTAQNATVRVQGLVDSVFLSAARVGDPFEIFPGTVLEIPVLFQPLDDLELRGAITVDLCEAGCTVPVVVMGRGAGEPLACEMPDFPPTAVGDCSPRGVDCTSVVDDPIALTAVRLTPSDPTFQLIDPLPMSVDPRQRTFIPVQFCPEFEGRSSASLEVSVESQGINQRPYIAAEVIGDGVRSADCSLQFPLSVDFGGVVPDTEESRTVNIGNQGTLPCAITLLGTDSLPGIFRLESPSAGQTVVLDSGESFAVTVAFRPLALQSYDGFLVFETNDPRNPNGSVQLTGTGITDRSYSIAQRGTPTFSPLPGRSVVWTGNADEGVADVTLPFSFEFLGRSSRFIRVSSNGFITFSSVGNATESRNQELPSPTPPNGIVALWWDDLNPGRPGTPGLVTTRTSNSNGRTTFHIAWIGVARTDGAPDRITGEIRLLANSNIIEVHYGAYTDSPSLDRFSASGGWEGFAGVRGMDMLGCGAACRGRQFPENTLFTLTPTQL